MLRSTRLVLSITSALLCVLGTSHGDAHPGGTAADGCHKCRKDCAKWDVKPGVRHCHGGGKDSKKKQTPAKPQKRRVRVTKVIDGDTVKVVTLGEDPSSFTVRLKGIDCPESHRNAKCVRDEDCEEDAPRGRRATHMMRALVDDEVVVLWSTGGPFEKDNHGRTLAYLHLGGTDVGLHLIRGGFCEDFSHRYPHPRQRDYKQAEP